MCPSQIACQSANTEPTVPPKDRPLPDISATANIGRCTWADIEWSIVVEFGDGARVMYGAASVAGAKDCRFPDGSVVVAAPRIWSKD